MTAQDALPTTMAESGKAPSGPPPGPQGPQAELMRMMTSVWASQATYVAAKLGWADDLANGPLSPEELANRHALDGVATLRVLRALDAAGVVTAQPDGCFGLAPAGELLRSDAPGSVRYVAIMHGEETFRCFGELLYTIQTGRPAFEKIYGAGYFSYLAEHPDVAATFHAAMGVSAKPPVVLDDLDLTAAKKIVDIGGGSGSLLSQLLSADPDAAGVLFDLPSAIEEAKGSVAPGLRSRIEFQAGDFHDAIPQNGDLYVLSRVLHNWDDDTAGRLLKEIYRALPSGGRVCVLERLIPEGPGFHPGKLADLVMMAVLGGRDRTESEYRALLSGAGFDRIETYAPVAAKDPRAESALVAVKP